MQLLARARWLLARHPTIYWLVAGGAGLLVVAGVVDRIDRLDEARRAWGASTTVWVATDLTEAGATIEAEPRALPAAVLSDTVMADDPTGRVAVQRLDRGEVIHEADLGDGPLALLPDGWHGVAIARDDITVRARPGDRVSVVAAGAVLVDSAVVIAADDLSITVGVPAADAPAVATAAGDRSAVLTLRRP